MTHGPQKPNSASLALPFFQVVVDYETRRFSVDGPLTDIEAWDREIVRIRSAGRDVRSFPTQPNAVNETTGLFRSLGFDEWPAGSIVEMPRISKNGAKASQDVPTESLGGETVTEMPATSLNELPDPAPTRAGTMRRRRKPR